MGVDIANSAWSSPNYSDLIIGYHTGIRIGAAYSGTRFYANSPTTDTNNTGHGNGGEALIFTVGGAAGTNDTKVEGIGYAGESFRAPLFYDNNNTNYVFHGDGTSVLNQAIISGATAGWSLQLGANDATRVQSDAARSSLVINAAYYPHLYINATSGTSNSNHGSVMSMTGNISGGYRRWSMGWANWNPTVFTMGSYDSTANPHYGCGGGLGVTTWGSRFWFNTSGTGQAHNDWRAPIFYDSTDTGYYLHPNSTSVLSLVNHQVGVGVNQTGSQTTAHGVSLYGTYTGGVPTYGMMFTGTSNQGTHGAVTNAWATFFTMNNDDSRGWIFKKVGGTNSASISAGGVATFDGSVISPIHSGTISTTGDGQNNYPFRLGSDYNSYMVAAASNTWGLFWAGNVGARYGTNGNGGPGNIWGNSGNPNEFVFVGSDSTKWTIYGNDW